MQFSVQNTYNLCKSNNRVAGKTHSEGGEANDTCGDALSRHLQRHVRAPCNEEQF